MGEWLSLWPVWLLLAWMCGVTAWHCEYRVRWQRWRAQRRERLSRTP